MRKPAWIALFLIALFALPAAAQQDDRGPITWLAYSKVKPGKTEAAVQMILEEKAMMDKLVAEGAVLSWGAATPINHSPDDAWNFVQWVSLPSWDKVDAWVGVVMGKMSAMSADERTAQMARGQEIFEAGSHFDEVVRHAVISRGAGNPPRYFYSAEFKAQPGKSEDMVEFFKGAVVPLLDRLVSDGTLTSYGVYSTELHIDVDWTHRFWYGLPNLGAIGKMTKAFNDARKPSFNAWAGSVFDLGGHSDKVLMVLHYGK